MLKKLLNHCDYKKKNEKSSRLFRVSEIIRKAISAVLIKNELPIDIPFSFPLSVIKVEMNSDLRIAYIYVSTHEKINDQLVLEKLNISKQYLSREVSKLISLKFLPKLIFRYDESIEDMNKIEKILKSKKVINDLRKN